MGKRSILKTAQVAKLQAELEASIQSNLLLNPSVPMSSQQQVEQVMFGM